jgi:ankyrin repeat protein
MVELLLECNADIEGKTHCKFTPMHFACKFGRRNVIELLTSKNGLLTTWDQWEKVSHH